MNEPCSECGGGEYCPPSKSGSLYQLLYMVFFFCGGFLLSAVYSLGKKERIQCSKCGRFYEAHTPKTKRYRAVFIALIILIIIGLVYEVFF